MTPVTPQGMEPKDEAMKTTQDQVGIPFRGALGRLGMRELEVACCLACGDDIAAIARHLDLSPASVRAAIRRAVNRLGLADEASLRLLAEMMLGDQRLAA